MDSQLVPVSNATLTLQSYMVQEHILADLSAAAAYEIAFLAEVPPLGYSTYTISPAQSGQAGSYHPAARTLVSSWANSTKGDSGRRETQATVSVSSGAVTLTVSPHTGRILSLSRNSDGVATQLNTEVRPLHDTPWCLSCELEHLFQLLKYIMPCSLSDAGKHIQWQCTLPCMTPSLIFL